MSQPEPELTTPRSRLPRNWRDPATVGTIVTALTALVAAIAALRAPAPPETKAEASYEVLATEIRRQNDTIQRLHADQQALRAWLRGFYQSQGIEVQDIVPPQAVAFELKNVEPSVPVVGVVRPSTTSRKPPEPVGVRVLTPLPKSSPKPAEPTLPSADSL